MYQKYLEKVLLSDLLNHNSVCRAAPGKASGSAKKYNLYLREGTPKKTANYPLFVDKGGGGPQKCIS